MTTAQVVKKHLAASDRVAKSIGKSRTKARKFLIKAGVLNKSGKKLINHCG